VVGNTSLSNAIGLLTLVSEYHTDNAGDNAGCGHNMNRKPHLPKLIITIHHHLHYLYNTTAKENNWLHVLVKNLLSQALAILRYQVRPPRNTHTSV